MMVVIDEGRSNKEECTEKSVGFREQHGETTTIAYFNRLVLSCCSCCYSPPFHTHISQHQPRCLYNYHSFTPALSYTTTMKYLVAIGMPLLRQSTNGHVLFIGFNLSLFLSLLLRL
jgi:hypothetical protein